MEKSKEPEVRCEFLASRLSTSNVSTSGIMTSNFPISYFLRPTSDFQLFYIRVRKGRGWRGGGGGGGGGGAEGDENFCALDALLIY